MTSDAEKSFKVKLRAIAKEKNRDPVDLWQSLTLERFLVRLANSEYSKHFVLKGGILLSKYIEIGRETTDLDFLAQQISNEVDKLKIIFEKIATIDLQDGFSFRDIKVNELAHPHMGYPGVEVSMMAYFVEPPPPEGGGGSKKKSCLECKIFGTSTSEAFAQSTSPRFLEILLMSFLKLTTGFVPIRG